MRSRADATRQLNIHISFAPRNPAGLAKLLADLHDPASPHYHRWLSPTSYNAAFGRTPGEVSAVRQWLSRQGFRVVDSSPRGVSSIATVTQAESAFATQVVASSHGALYANASDPEIPASLADVIGSIEGLDNARHSLALAIRPPSAQEAAVAAPRDRGEARRRPDRRLLSRKSAALIPAAVTDYNNGFGLAFGPADLWTFYDETTLLNAGTDGGGGIASR